MWMKWVADKIQCQLLQSKAHREKILNSTFFFMDFELDITIQERDFGMSMDLKT